MDAADDGEADTAAPMLPPMLVAILLRPHGVQLSRQKARAMTRVIIEPVLLLPVFRWWRDRPEPVDERGRGRAARVWCDEHGYVGPCLVFGRDPRPEFTATDIADQHEHDHHDKDPGGTE